MKYAFVDKKRMTSSTRNLIEAANIIIAEMAAAGYTLTLRQLYYQFVSKKLLENNQLNYSRLGVALDTGRKQGLVDWAAIEDRERYIRKEPTFDNPSDFLTRTEHWFKRNLWEDQDYYCEAWVEKSALLGVIGPPCEELRVPYFACRGYTSSTALFDAGARVKRQLRKGKQVVIFHLGDHDPSGVDMSRANRDALAMFAETDDFELRRLALNWDQIEEHSPPPNPAKETDSRVDGYKEMMINDHDWTDDEFPSWELDALPPAVIDELIRFNIALIMDEAAFERAKEDEESERAEIQLIAAHWGDAAGYIKDNYDED